MTNKTLNLQNYGLPGIQFIHNFQNSYLLSACFTAGAGVLDSLLFPALSQKKLSDWFLEIPTSSPGPSPRSKWRSEKAAEILQESWSVLSRDTF